MVHCVDFAGAPVGAGGGGAGVLITTSAGVVRPDELREKELLLCTPCCCWSCAAATSPWLAFRSPGVPSGVASGFESPSRSSRSRLCSSVFGTEEADAGNMDMISHNTERKALP